MPFLHDLLPKIWNNGSQELEDFLQNPWTFKKVFDVDVKETEKEIAIHAELPGFKKEEIQLELEDYTLTIRASRSEEKEEKNEKYFKRERQFGKVERTIPLPAEVVSGSANAKYEDGVLKITLEKKHPALPKREVIKIE